MSDPVTPVPTDVNASSIVPPQPWQFTLRELMISMLVLSVYFAVIGYFGWNGGILLGLTGVCYFLWHYGFTTITQSGVGFCFVLLLSACVISDQSPILKEVGRGKQCGFHLKYIALGMQNYHDAYNAFPPAYIADASGKPMHSWRVLILPFIEEKTLYDRYRFDEPWDGPNNRLLAPEISRIYRCPSETDQRSMETSYVVVVGPGTVFPDDKNITIPQIKDGTANTLLVVEVHNSGIHWMESRDLHVTQMATTINPASGQGISGPHPPERPWGAMVAFVDGHVQQLPNDTDPAQLRAMLTIAGGEAIPLE